MRLKEIELPGSVEAFTDYLQEALVEEPRQRALVFGVDRTTPQVVSERNHQVIVVDRDERKLTQARSNWEEGNISGVVGSFENLPIESGSIDLVAGRHIVHWVPSAAQEARRVSRKGSEAHLSVPIGFGRFTERNLEAMNVKIARTKPLSRSRNPLARGTVMVIKK